MSSIFRLCFVGLAMMVSFPTAPSKLEANCRTKLVETVLSPFGFRGVEKESLNSLKRRLKIWGPDHYATIKISKKHLVVFLFWENEWRLLSLRKKTFNSRLSIEEGAEAWEASELKTRFFAPSLFFKARIFHFEESRSQFGAAGLSRSFVEEHWMPSSIKETRIVLTEASALNDNSADEADQHNLLVYWTPGFAGFSYFGLVTPFPRITVAAIVAQTSMFMLFADPSLLTGIQFVGLGTAWMLAGGLPYLIAHLQSQRAESTLNLEQSLTAD